MREEFKLYARRSLTSINKMRVKSIAGNSLGKSLNSDLEHDQCSPPELVQIPVSTVTVSAHYSLLVFVP